MEDALLLVDGKQTETGKTLKLTYGSHDVTVYADGYDVWKRNLYVNSPEATIIIKLKDEEDSESSGTSSSQNSESSQNSSTSQNSLTANSHQENSQGSQPSQRTENTTSESEKSESEKRDDETDILKDLLSSLYNTSTNVSK